MLPAVANRYFGELGRNTNTKFGRLTDSVRQGGTFEGQQPLQIPRNNIPGLDGDSGGSNPFRDLTDILRRGNGSTGGAPSGGYLWSIIRSMLSSALGFQSNGIFGWIIRMIVYRYGWTIVQSIFRRLFLGRKTAN